MRFPIFALIAPLVTSVVLWAVTGSAYTLLFALLGPVIAAGHYVDSRFHARKERARQEAVAEDEELIRSQQEHLDFCTHRAEMLLRYPPSSFYAEQHEILRPAWAAGAVPEGAQRIIRLGTSRVDGMPVLLCGGIVWRCAP
jgi:DNA segregation ATPase FtsK/SpoIIIE, S-DNA-T family